MSTIQVVIIEDHDLSRVGLTAALQHSGAVGVLGSAPNGRQGLEMIQQYKPDVAILDIGLPDIDGIEVTQQLKQAQKKTKPYSPRCSCSQRIPVKIPY